MKRQERQRGKTKKRHKEKTHPSTNQEKKPQKMPTCGISVSNFWSSETWECKFLWVKPPSLGEWVSEVAQSCPTLSGPMDYSLLGSSVHGIFQARILEWVAISFSTKSGYLLQKPLKTVKIIRWSKRCLLMCRHILIQPLALSRLWVNTSVLVLPTHPQKQNRL